MRPIKQSNSMKELLKKLKRHDTLVLASGVVVASLLCGAFVYVTTPAISADAAQEEVRRDSLGVQKKASDQLKEIENYLERLDKVVTDSQELVKEVQTVQNEQKELTEKTLETQKTLESQKTTSTEKNNNNSSTKVVEKINGLDKALDSIHSEIQATNSQIKELKSSMDKGGNKDSDKDKESFDKISNALNDIKKSCDKSGTDVSGIVEQLKSSNSDNSDKQKSMITSLETIVKSLEKVETKETLSRMETELKDTQSTYISLLDNVEKSVSKTSDSVKKVGDKVSKVAENVNNVENGVSKVAENVTNVGNGVSEVLRAQANADNRINTLGTDIGSVKTEAQNINGLASDIKTQVEGVDGEIKAFKGSIKEIKDSIDNSNTKMDQISQRVEEVFQCSNSSRSKLASVLFETCGYEAAEGATFNELIDAVKLIPAHVMNSKTVTYERHYHKDVSGNTVKDRSTKKGGCFTKAIFHVHTSACYVTDTTYYYRAQLRYNGSASAMTPESRITALCVQCGEKGRLSDMKNHTHETTDKTYATQRGIVSTKSTQRLVCTKNGNTVEYYIPACGFSHGEITRAIIEFNHSNANNNISTSMISESKSLTIDDALFDFDVNQDSGAGIESTENYNENEGSENNESSEDGTGNGAYPNNEENPENTDNPGDSEAEDRADQSSAEESADNNAGEPEGEQNEMQGMDKAYQNEESAVSDGNSQG